MLVNIVNQQSALKISSVQVRRLVKGVLYEEQADADEVSIYFVETPEICQLHAQFFHDPEPTDCISFPIDQQGTHPYCILGEVFVCPSTALSYTQTHHVDLSEELSLYIIHGLLHLLGYNDLSEKERRKMRLAEKRVMQSLKTQQLILKVSTG